MSMWLQPCGCVTEDGHPVVTCPLHDASDEIDQGRWEGEGGYVRPSDYARWRGLYDVIVGGDRNHDEPFVLPDLRDRTAAYPNEAHRVIWATEAERQNMPVHMPWCAAIEGFACTCSTGESD